VGRSPHAGPKRLAAWSAPLSYLDHGLKNWLKIGWFLKNQSIFIKIRETDPDWFHRFSINRFFLKKIDFFKNSLPVSVPVYW
jgi:hypothetical protein